MPIEIDYGFEGPKKDGPSKQEDVRTNFHITRCCANCKFFVNKRQASYTGFCKYPDPAGKNLWKRGGEKRDLKEIEKTWSRAHSTMLCDLYQFRSRAISIQPIEKWLGKEILNDGTMKDE